MTKLTIITGNRVCGTADVVVRENNERTVYALPVGVELTVADAVANAAAQQYDCQLGYYVCDEQAAQSLPTAGIADGSYCFIISTGELRFLASGAWG